MLGRSKPVVFESRGRRRSRVRVPRWLVLLLSGIAVGACGVVLIQERYLPPRLSYADTVELRNSYQSTEAARVKLKTELADTTQKLQTALADNKKLSDDLASSRAAVGHLRDDLASAVSSLPPDPRGATVEVRAGKFVSKGDMLAYDVVLTRDRARAQQPMPAAVQFVITGETAQGTPKTISPASFGVSIGASEIVRGNLPLPDGFKPTQTTIQVLDHSGGRSLGMRVFLIGKS
jgi:hypothetical protein